MLTHTELIEIGYKWCMKRCAFAFTDLKTTNKEIPDVIGFIGDYTFLLEAKTSKSDFIKDKNKSFRKKPKLGMGDFRFFITPENLIELKELPYKWGLIEVNPKGKVTKLHNPFGKGNIYSSWIKNDKNILAEYRLMYSGLRRK